MTKLDDLMNDALKDQNKAALAETKELGYFALSWPSNGGSRALF